MARRITAIAFLGAVGALAVVAKPAVAAVSPLASLDSPTVQSLIDLGADGILSDDVRYFDFSYAASANAPAADAVQVRSTSDGLRFVADWTADGGSNLSSTIRYDVEPVDASALIDRVDLLANGTAPVPAAGTFVAASSWAMPVADASAASLLLSTYDDGHTTPDDTTFADTDSVSAPLPVPQSELAVTDTLGVVAAADGVAIASAVQNGFDLASTPVPEPAATAVLGLLTLRLASRRPTRKAK